MRWILLVVVFLSFASSSANQSNSNGKTFGLWRVLLVENGDVVAGTSVDNYETGLFYRCYSSNKKCAFSIRAKTTCRNGDETPLLLNTDLAATSITGVCLVDSDGRSSMIINDFNQMYRLVHDAKIFAVAVPIGNSVFTVVRLNLSGITDVMTYSQNVIDGNLNNFQ
ncbi:hypothetical protein [Tolumonas lignilytica]|uniref:hypothetical protein n=1 Tax=Tolumonas lignilytica TaxID=1283284 RepID=UPI00126951E6|nr:hypothetical protein [Tolumonas lignilytica]